MDETIIENLKQPYLHNVKYYETDKMKITHHSNYIRWMEEARIDWLEQIGHGYDKLEDSGIISPVVSVSCRYLRSTTFNDNIAITTRLVKYTGVKFAIEYEMVNLADNQTCAVGLSEHCFTKPTGMPISIKKNHRELDATFRSLLTGSSLDK